MPKTLTKATLVTAVVAAFAARLRHSVELDVIDRDLIGVINESVQPTQVALWLAPGPS